MLAGDETVKAKILDLEKRYEHVPKVGKLVACVSGYTLALSIPLLPGTVNVSVMPIYRLGSHIRMLDVGGLCMTTALTQ